MTPPPFTLAMLRDALLLAALAVLTFLGLRRWLGDRYLVPTGSMEPVLHGSELDGDVVFVDKTQRANDRQRHDLVVVVNPSRAGEQLVKRIAACGDDVEQCWINVLDGDIWLGPDAQRVRRVQKDPLATRHLRVPWGHVPGSAAASAVLDLTACRSAAAGNGGNGGGEWQLLGCGLTADEARSWFTAAAQEARRAPGALRVLPEGCIGSGRPVDAGFVDATGARGAVGNDKQVTDAGMTLDVAGISGELLATIETHGEALTFHWQPATGRLVSWRDGVDCSTAELPPTAAPRRIEFGLLDERLFFCVDGDPQQLHVVPRRADGATDRVDNGPGGARSLVHVAVLGGSDRQLRFRGLAVFHDIFAYRDPIAGLRGHPGSWPRQVPPGHWFLLGDSAFDSHDSRHFGPVPMTSFLGVPRAVLGPWPRTRWLDP
jgi:hypothetical protein